MSFEHRQAASYNFSTRKQKNWASLLQYFAEIHALADFVDIFKLECSKTPL